MSDNTLLNTAFAVLFGGIALALPGFMGGINVTSVFLAQMTAITVAGFFVANIIISTKTSGLVAIISSLTLLMTGVVVADNIGTTQLDDIESVDTHFDSNFNGSFSGDMIQDGTYLELASPPSSGTFTNDVIYTNGTIEFNRIVVDMETLNENDNATMRVDAYEDGSLTESVTYDLNQGLQDLNVSKLNTPSEPNSYRWRLNLEADGQSTPQFDSVRFEKSITNQTTTSGEYGGFSEFMPILVYFFGGILVAVSGMRE